MTVLVAAFLACRTPTPAPGDSASADTGSEVAPVGACASFAVTDACPHAADADLDCLHAGASGGTDCDDADPEVGACAAEDDPGCMATGRETCNGLDDDCNGHVDDAWLLLLDRPAVTAATGLLGEGGAPLLVLGVAGATATDDGAIEVYDATGQLLVRVEGTGQSPSFGSQLATGRDLTGDGQVDLAIAAPYATTPLGESNGRVIVLPGPIDAATTLNLAAGWFDGGELAGQPGAQLAMAPDLDGDGLDELVIGYYRHVVVFSGAPLPAARLADAALVVEVNTGGGAWQFASGADDDGDGRRELLLGMDTYGGGTGLVARVGSSDLGFSIIASDAAWPGLGQQLVVVEDVAWSLSQGTPVRLSDFSTLDVGATSLADGGDLDGDGDGELLVGDGSTLRAFNREGAELGVVRGERVLSSRGLAPAVDLDGDGVGDPPTLSLGGVAVVDGGRGFALACDGDGDGHSAASGDCDDALAGVYPGAPDVCDGRDNDCNGVVDFPADTRVATDVSELVVFEAGSCTEPPSGWALGGEEAVAFGEHAGATVSGLSHLVHGGASGAGGSVVLLGHAEVADVVLDTSASGAAIEVASATIGDGTTLARSGELGPAGDIDGDGAGDVWLKVVADAGGSTLAVFPGPLQGSLDVDDAAWLSALPVGWTRVILPAGRDGADLDGDGHDDVIASDPDSYYGWGRVGVVTTLPSGASAFDDVATVHLFGEPDEGLGASLAAGMDVDGDGIDDALVGAAGHLRLLRGGPCPALSARVDGHGGDTLLADLDGDGLGEAWSTDGSHLYRDADPVRSATAIFEAGTGALGIIEQGYAWVLAGQ